MKHELKILPKYFEAVNCGKKNFEIRINDRNYQEDDELILKEWERGKYTGRECRRWVGYIYHGDGTYGIAENTVIMALKRSAPTACLDNDTADRKTEQTEIDTAPTIDAVPVVRCKDCPNWQTDWELQSYPSGHYCAMIDKFTDGEWFCATSIQEDD